MASKRKTKKAPTATVPPPSVQPDGGPGMTGSPPKTSLRARQERMRAALASTEFTTYEACVAEWLFSDNSVKTDDNGNVVADHMYLRSRFEHGLSSAPGSDVINMAKCLVEDVLMSLVFNSEPGIAHIRDLFEHSRGLDREYSCVRAALDAFESTLRSWHNAKTPPDDSERLGVVRWRLRVFDERFLDLPPQETAEVLTKVDLSATSGGRAKLGARGALARLTALCGAFGCNSVNAAESKIAEAMSRVTPPFTTGRQSEKIAPLIRRPKFGKTET